MQNADNMPFNKRYPWNGLYNMLMDSKHGATANDLKAAITASMAVISIEYLMIMIIILMFL